MCLAQIRLINMAVKSIYNCKTMQTVHCSRRKGDSIKREKKNTPEMSFFFLCHLPVMVVSRAIKALWKLNFGRNAKLGPNNELRS